MNNLKLTTGVVNANVKTVVYFVDNTSCLHKKKTTDKIREKKAIRNIDFKLPYCLVKSLVKYLKIGLKSSHSLQSHFVYQKSQSGER